MEKLFSLPHSLPHWRGNDLARFPQTPLAGRALLSTVMNRRAADNPYGPPYDLAVGVGAAEFSFIIPRSGLISMDECPDSVPA